MNKKQAEEIQKDAKKLYKGKIEVAIAAHLYTPGVVAKCGGKVPPFADKQKLGLLKGQFNRHFPIKVKTAAGTQHKEPAADTKTAESTATGTTAAETNTAADTTAAPKPKAKGKSKSKAKK